MNELENLKTRIEILEVDEAVNSAVIGILHAFLSKNREYAAAIEGTFAVFQANEDYSHLSDEQLARIRQRLAAALHTTRKMQR